MLGFVDRGKRATEMLDRRFSSRAPFRDPELDEHVQVQASLRLLLECAREVRDRRIRRTLSQSARRGVTESLDDERIRATRNVHKMRSDELWMGARPGQDLCRLSVQTSALDRPETVENGASDDGVRKLQGRFGRNQARSGQRLDRLVE